MRAAILSIGSELLRGDIVDTNAAFLARELQQLGFDVRRVIQVGDDLSDLTAATRAALSLADVTVTTGGLGPTLDDLTREAIATVFEEELYHDDALVAELRARFAGLQRPMPERNLRQATLISSSVSLPNPHGSAPGWYAAKDGKIITALPGPPSEMQPMWTNELRPRLAELLPNTVATASLMTFGLGESLLEERIEDVILRWPDVTIATYAKSNGVQVHISAQAGTLPEAQHLLSLAEEQVRDRLGVAIYGRGDDTLATAVGRLLKDQNLTLATMESATGGQVASMITDVSGSGDYFIGGLVTYTPELKQRYGVPADVIEAHGVVSAETAAAMATAACGTVDTDAGIGVTGIAGSEPMEHKSPGTCYVAVAVRSETVVREIHRPGSREGAKRFFAQSALDLLRCTLLTGGKPQ